MANRFPPLAEHELSDAQRKVVQEIAAGPRGGVRGPFIPLLRSPDLASAVQKVGEYLRYSSSLKAHLTELTVLLAARAYGSAFEWQAHAPLAIKAGLAPEIVDAIGRRERPKAMPVDVADIHDFVVALLEQHAVDDTLYARALAHIGERGIIDLAATCGYYIMLAMVLNTAQTPMPEGRTAPFAPAFHAT